MGGQFPIRFVGAVKISTVPACANGKLTLQFLSGGCTCRFVEIAELKLKDGFVPSVERR
jgi:hypothetical protein